MEVAGAKLLAEAVVARAHLQSAGIFARAIADNPGVLAAPLAPHVAAALGHGAEALGSLASVQSQMIIGPGVNVASELCQSVLGMLRASESGAIPLLSALTDATAGASQLSARITAALG